MIDAGDFHPAAERPRLLAAGVVLPPRLTTTDEQLREAKKHLEAVALSASAAAARALVHWTRSEPSVVEVHGHVEHLTLPTGVEEVFATDRVVERDVDGHELPRDEIARLERLKAELAAMREHSAGPAV